jgi:hypothetical protein
VRGPGGTVVIDGERMGEDVGDLHRGFLGLTRHCR